MNITAISQHALERFIQRSGVKFPSVGAALERLWDITQKAQLHEVKGEQLVFTAKGWRLLVTDACVRTCYLNRTVQAKRGKREVEV